MTREEAKQQLSNSVYAATKLIEELESAGLVRGNGHHMRQHLASAAADLLDERWLPDNNRTADEKR